MSHINSVLALRQSELLKSTKPFYARGSKVKRCEECLLAKVHCICFAKPVPSAKSAFLILMYNFEYFKPSNTGRLIADIAPDNFAFIWNRTLPDPALLALLSDQQYQPIIVFPNEYAEATRCIQKPVRSDKKYLFILLDGTWREAKKMFKNSPYLDNFPVLGFKTESGSNYRLREAAHLHQLCTAEVAIEVLQLIDEKTASTELSNYFDVFCKNYMAGKPHLNPTISCS